MSNPQMASVTSELEEMSEDLNEMLRRSAFAQDQMGRVYFIAVSRRLAQQAGYKNAWDYFSRRVKGLTRATVNWYSHVTLAWGAEFTMKYGMERMRALNKYLYLHAASDPDAKDPGVLMIRVPQADGTEVMKAFTDCSVEEMRRALRPKPKPSAARLSVVEAVRILFLKDSLVRHFQGVAPVHLDVRNQDGRTLVSVQNVPLAEVERLMAALRAGLDAQPASLRAVNQTAA